ncbi:MAG: eL32 family ribosomal protein [Candidatus Diapherotrites archaeon]
MAKDKKQSTGKKAPVKAIKKANKGVKQKPKGKKAENLADKAVKKEIKTENKEIKKSGKEALAKEKPAKKTGGEKSKDILKLQSMIKKKVSVNFKGRFGQRHTRKNRAKWKKWRKSRGIDIQRQQEDGKIPSTGYGARKEIRGIHPSGFKEVYVRTINDLSGINGASAARLQSTLGARKRKEIIAEARKRNIKVLNR